ncbi:MAG: SURF1 family protein [Rhodospirillales bacterium]|nr:SURF1 family protein [Rhodospirillales bacterium]
MTDPARRSRAGRTWAKRTWIRPGRGLTLATALALAVLLGLGTWQVQRLQWKEALIAERQSRATAEPTAFPALVGDPAPLEFTRVRVTGRFLHDRELQLANRTYRKSVGIHVVTPLVLEDGRTLLVDRGWVPMDRRDPARRPEGQVEGPVTLEAMLRRGGWRGSAWLRPDNDPAGNTWLWLDLPAMAEAAGLEGAVTVLYLQAGPAANPGGLPKGGYGAANLRNDHLGYAVTWYALAAALVVIYLLFHTRRGD